MDMIVELIDLLIQQRLRKALGDGWGQELDRDIAMTKAKLAAVMDENLSGVTSAEIVSVVRKARLDRRLG